MTALTARGIQKVGKTVKGGKIDQKDKRRFISGWGENKGRGRKEGEALLHAKINKLKLQQKGNEGDRLWAHLPTKLGVIKIAREERFRVDNIASSCKNYSHARRMKLKKESQR